LIPLVARHGWLIITRDNIAENRREKDAVRQSGAKMIALNQLDAANKWGQLRGIHDALARYRAAGWR
jgi:hypothetical protein